MNDAQIRFLAMMPDLPGRLNAQQTAWVINCQLHDIPALVNAKLIRPLGNPPANGIKYFAALDIMEAIKDRNWLVRVSATITVHWQRKNASRKQMTVEVLAEGKE